MSDKSSNNIENFSNFEIQQPHETVFENYTESSDSSSIVENYNQVSTSVGGILDKVNQSFVYLKESNINNGYGFESYSFIDNLTGKKNEEILCSNGSCGLPSYKLYSNYDPNYESAYGFYAPSHKQSRSKSFKDLTPRSDKPLMQKPKRDAFDKDISGAPVYGRFAPVDISNSKVSSEITPKKKKRSSKRKSSKRRSSKRKSSKRKLSKKVSKRKSSKKSSSKKASKKSSKKALKKLLRRSSKKLASSSKRSLKRSSSGSSINKAFKKLISK